MPPAQVRVVLTGGPAPTLRLGSRALGLGAPGQKSPIANVRQLQAPLCEARGAAFQIVLETAGGQVRGRRRRLRGGVRGGRSAHFPHLSDHEKNIYAGFSFRPARALSLVFVYSVLLTKLAFAAPSAAWHALLLMFGVYWEIAWYT